MKFSLIFLVFNLFTIYCEHNKSAVTRAFEEIAKTLMKLNHEVTIMNFAEDTGIFDEILLKNLRKNNFPQKLTFVKSFENQISVNDSAQTMSNVSSKIILTNSSPVSFNFFVYCHKATINDILKFGEYNIEKRKKRFENYIKFNRLAIDSTGKIRKV
jgi:hypothetical protein